MRDNIQTWTQKDFFALKNIKYKRLTNATVNLMAYTQQKQKINKTGIIEFPFIENSIEKQRKNMSVLILQKKIIEQQLTKKMNLKSYKSFTKNVEQVKRRAQDRMNTLGLDIIKIQCISQDGRKQQKRQENFKKISKISQKMCDLKLQKDFSQQLTNRKKTQSIQTIQQLHRLELTDSLILMNKRKSMNSMLTQKVRRRMSINIQQEKDEDAKQTVSPSRKKRKQYLYKKLQGTQNARKEEFGQVYQRRIKSYMDFLFKLQIAHNISISLDIKFADLSCRPKKLKAYVGPGNNGSMIKGLLKRRFWWTIVDQRTDDCQFVWTQIKINQIFKNQKRSTHQKSKLKQIQSSKSKSNSKSPKKVKTPGLVKDKQVKFMENNQFFNYKLLNSQDLETYKRCYQKNKLRQKQLTFCQKLQNLPKQTNILSQTQLFPLLHNHLQNNFYLGNKKALFHNLKQYYSLINQDPFQYIPFTFHIKNGLKDPQYMKFCQLHKKRQRIIKKQLKDQEDGYSNKKKTRNIWIVKPGENSNQGRGITVIDQIYQLNTIIKQTSNNKTNNTINKNEDVETAQTQQGQKHTYIVQMYIDRPFLYNNRKFDIRHYMLITNFYGITRAYWYQQGYIRTSSYEFNVHNFQPQIHLTNDAVQKNFPDYGKYEPYNKISYEEFQRYLDLSCNNKKYDFKSQILPEMKKMATDAAKSVYTKISPGNLMNNFQIFGLDFMIDKNFRPWLIQINTNPCLDCACPLLDRIIPYMVQQSFKLSLDLSFPPPHHYPNTSKHFAPLLNLQIFKYQLIFDSQFQGDQVEKIYRRAKGNLIDQIGEIQEDQQFKDQGKEIKLDDFT